MVYARRVGDRDLTFDFAAGLTRNNLLIADRETSSVWSQLDNQAISGPLRGTPMRVVPSVQCTWKHWRETHPATRVTIVRDEPPKRYLYFSHDFSRPGPMQRPTEHDTSTLGLGLAYGGEAMFFSFRALDKVSSPVRLTMGGRSVTVHYRADALTAWAEDADGKLLPGVLAYHQGWKAFHPNSGKFTAPTGEE